MSFYQCKHFKIHELVHPIVMQKYDEVNAWELLDKRMLRVADHLREKFGLCIINDWYTSGEYENSGLRVDYGSPGSAHMFGKAFDLKFPHANNIDVYHYILNQSGYLYDLGLRRIEHISSTPSWIHIDSKPAITKVNPGEIYSFLPSRN